MMANCTDSSTNEFVANEQTHSTGKDKWWLKSTARAIANENEIDIAKESGNPKWFWLE
jgi:hypothetical protein